MKLFLLLLTLTFIQNGNTSGTSVGNGLVADSVEKSCKKADGTVTKMKSGESCDGEVIEAKPADKPADKPKEKPASEDKPAPKK
jgi:hypothetical protein